MNRIMSRRLLWRVYYLAGLCALLLIAAVSACKSAPDSDASTAGDVAVSRPAPRSDGVSSAEKTNQGGRELPGDGANSANNEGAEGAQPSVNPDFADYPQLKQIELAQGFQIRMFAPAIPGARSLQVAPDGTVFVGTRKQGKVWALRDSDQDGRADQTYVIAEGLQSPNGVAFHDGALYVAEIEKIWRYPDILKDLENPPKPQLVSDAFPSDAHHGWKFIAFGPDEKLYVPVGAPCNICEPDPEEYAHIRRMNPDGSGMEVFARGVRNTVGFAWHPETGELWFTDNGRDMMGDTGPPDELNHAPEIGMNFGYPYCHGQAIRDPEFGKGADCSQYTPPVQELEAHAAALGMRFYTGKMFPAAYRNQIFIAEHGSWNRSEKVGYRVVQVRLDEDGKARSYEPFARGWLQGQTPWGRPVDVEVMPDGALLVSDDHAGAVYRVVYLP